MTGPRILVVTDSGADAGAGCVMRALALATALEAQGAVIALLGPPAVRDVLEAFAPTATRPPMVSAEPQDLAAAADRERFDAVVFDHPDLSERDHRAIGQGRPVLVVDDRADPSVPGLAKIARRDHRMMLHVDTPHMARITAEADIGVGAPGQSLWERCVLGLPSVLVVVSEDQRAAAGVLAERGAALVVDVADPAFEAAFDRALMRLMRDAALRRQLAGQSALLCDGLGAGRTAAALLALMAARGA